MRHTILLALIVRILIALTTRTFFQPDEYFQALEPAHHLVFGYGKLTWEWVAPHPIRSFIYPALNVPTYWLLRVLGIDWDCLLIAGPRVLHGAFAAMTDVWVCELTRKVLGERYVSTALFLSLTSFFHALSLSRSLSNSLETSLTTIALSHYLWDVNFFDRTSMRRCLAFAALACAIRPTNAVIWVYMISMLLWRLRTWNVLFLLVLFDGIVVATLVCSVIFIIDSAYYRKPTFTPLNFLVTNLSSVSLFYGSSPWHYHLSQTLPILCTTALPFVIHGIWIAWASENSVSMRIILGCLVWTTGVYSTAGHKEWRFLHPLLPLLHVLASKSLVDLRHYSRRKMQRVSDTTPTPQRPASPIRFTSYLPPIHTSHLFLILATTPISIFAVFFYCDAPISVMTYLRTLPEQGLSIGFLMPCHSTPWQAYFHRRALEDEGRMWALGCEPPLQNQSLDDYKDQTDVFYDSPVDYLLNYFPAVVNSSFPPSSFPSSIPGVVTSGAVWEHEWPRYLIMFGALLRDYSVGQILEDRGYEEIWSAGRSWDGDGKRKGGILVWKHP